MKVSCQSCGAQYNLPDEKVRGRKAKVRCKKCTAQIIVDGTAFPDDEDEATRVMQAPSATSSTEPTWTVNLSDEDQLDMTEAEILAGWRDGRVTDDAYVWREGMDEWLPILESPELSAAIRALDAAAPAAAAPGFLGLTPTGNATAVAPADATPSEASSGNVPASARTGSLESVGSSPAASESSSPSVPKAKAQKSEDTSKAFSFALAGAATSASSTKKIASRPPATTQTKSGGLFGNPQPTTTSSTSSGSEVGGGTSENSVMFSLDALKAAAAVEPSKPQRATGGNEARVTEDILTLGSPSRFDNNAMPLIDVEVPPTVARPDVANVFAPMSAPAAEQKKSSVGIWVVGALAVIGMVGAYVLGSRGSDQPVADNDVIPARTAESEQSEAKAASSVNVESTSAETASAEPSTSATSTAPSVAAAPNVGGGGRANTGGGTAKPTEKPDPKPDTDKPAAAKPAPAPAPAPAPKPAGAAFNVAAAKTALNNAAASAAGCRAPAGPSGTGKVQVTFAPSGNVTSALIVSGPFGGTPVGSCVARTFRAAKVPAFDGSPMTVSKSFTIN